MNSSVCMQDWKRCLIPTILLLAPPIYRPDFLSTGGRARISLMSAMNRPVANHRSASQLHIIIAYEGLATISVALPLYLLSPPTPVAFSSDPTSTWTYKTNPLCTLKARGGYWYLTYLIHCRLLFDFIVSFPLEQQCDERR